MAADNCRLLARNIADPDHARKLLKMAADFEAMAEAEDAVGSAANAFGPQATA